MKHPRPLRYLALGDSYTIGEAVEERDRWPVQLVGALRAEQREIADPEIVARTGWTTDELDAAITAHAPEGPYDLVSLLIGVNNQYRGRSVGEYREQFRGLLERAVGFAGGSTDRVFVLSIPDWGVTPFAEGRDRKEIGREIDSFNAVARAECAARGVRFVDITPGSRKAAVAPSLVASDGLHPSGAMYTEWTAAALPVVREMLGPSAEER